MKEINTLIEGLSFGWWVQMETNVVINQIIKLVRGGPPQKRDYLEKILFQFDADRLAKKKKQLEETHSILAADHQTSLDIITQNRTKGKLEEYVQAFTKAPRETFLKKVEETNQHGAINHHPQPEWLSFFMLKKLVCRPQKNHSYRMTKLPTTLNPEENIPSTFTEKEWKEATCIRTALATWEAEIGLGSLKETTHLSPNTQPKDPPDCIATFENGKAYIEHTDITPQGHQHAEGIRKKSEFLKTHGMSIPTPWATPEEVREQIHPLNVHFHEVPTAINYFGNRIDDAVKTKTGAVNTGEFSKNLLILEVDDIDNVILAASQTLKAPKGWIIILAAFRYVGRDHSILFDETGLKHEKPAKA